MNSLKLLVVASVLASSAFAQTSGFFVSAGGGVAQMKTGDFAVTNPTAVIYYFYSPSKAADSQVLRSTDKEDNATVARLTVGYRFDQAWDVRASFTDYGTSEVRMELPSYTQIINPAVNFVTAPVLPAMPVFQRNSVKYKASTLSLLPTYTRTLGNVKLRGGVGINITRSSANFEAAGLIPADVVIAIFPPPALTQRELSSPKERKTSLGYIISLGAEYQFTDKFSVGLSGNYTTFKIAVPSSPWASRSKSSVAGTALSAELSLAWHL
jgi:opacity protein-like surface antigen